MSEAARITIRRTGNAMWPWEAHCSACTTYSLHVIETGAAAINTRGVGNSAWWKALHAGLAHLRSHRTLPGLLSDEERP